MSNGNDMPLVKKKRITMADKKAVCSMLAALTGQRRPPNGAFSAVVACFSVHRSTCMRLQKQINSKIPSTENDDDDEEDINNILLDKHIPDGAFNTNKSKHDRDELQTKAKDMPFSNKRRTRMLAAQPETPQSTLMCVPKEKGSAFRRHSNALKPKLAEENQQARLQHALSKNRSECNNPHPPWPSTTQVQDPL